VPLEQGRPGYRPATLLKIYIYGYLNRVPSSRRLERECQRNIELFWLTGQLAPDFKTIADFRRDNGKAIREVCPAFVAKRNKDGTLWTRPVCPYPEVAKFQGGGDRNDPARYACVEP
jgi:transposase